MNVLHIAGLRFNKNSGISTMIPKIVENQNLETNVNAALLNCLQIDHRKEKAFSEKINFEYFQFANFSGGISSLKAPFNNPDIVVFHSTYIPSYYCISRQLIKNDIPYIVVPHGGLTYHAQNIKWLKKRLGNILFLNSIIRNANAIQYLSSGEAKESRFWKKNYFVASNGIETRNIPLLKKENTNNIRFTYLGRLDIYTKGLDILLEACLIAKDTLVEKNAEINIYGPDYRGGKKKLEKFIDENHLEEIVNVHSPVYGENKELTYLSTDIFILLSRSEGLPSVVLEALSYGVPCLLTPGTNMSKEIYKARCGWEVDYDPVNIAKKISQLISRNFKQKNYAQNAKNFVKKEYSWESVTEKTLREYKKIIETI